MPEDHRLALQIRQRLQSLHQVGRERSIDDRRQLADELAVVGQQLLLVEFDLPASLGAAEPVDAPVRGYPLESRLRIAGSIEAVERANRRDHRFLGDVVAREPVAREHVGDAMSPRPGPTNESLDRIALARSRTGDRVSAGPVGERGCCADCHHHLYALKPMCVSDDTVCRSYQVLGSLARDGHSPEPGSKVSGWRDDGAGLRDSG